ncbi:MAG: hypothetical protein ACI30J_05020 [Paludibacteraceae bacterium]
MELETIEIVLLAICSLMFCLFLGMGLWAFFKRDDEKQQEKCVKAFSPKVFHPSRVMVCYALFFWGLGLVSIWMAWSTIWGGNHFELFGISMSFDDILLVLFSVVLIPFCTLLFFWARKSKEEREDEEEKEGRE